MHTESVVFRDDLNILGAAFRSLNQDSDSFYIYVQLDSYGNVLRSVRINQLLPFQIRHQFFSLS